uniref:TPX2 microtubule nucleation factor n=1 Tax=Sphaeramia orbicularis TaxID=375764 RepID=A0A672YIN7_9TELE
MRNKKVDLSTAVLSPQVETNVDSAPSTPTPPNIVTSWGPGVPAQASRPRRTTAQPRRVSKRKESAPVAVAPPVKKHKQGPAAHPARRSSTASQKQLTSRNAPRTCATVASTNANTEMSSSEAQELERIRNLQKEVALQRKRNEASYKAALAGNPPPKKMALSTTVPKEFHFSTDTRMKTTSTSSSDHKEVDFIAQLRKPASPAKALRGATVPKPFSLSTGNKKNVEEPAAYVPMAEQIQQFYRRTPERYHLRSRQSQERGPSPVKGDHLKLTQPHTPQLMTRQRNRPPTVKSSAELEAEELDKLNKFKFKALELNRKILESTACLKKPAVKEPTVPEGFELQIEKRLQGRLATKKPQEVEEKPHTFKSQPVPKKILEGVTGLPEKKIVHPTVPESPAFALKKRIRLEHKPEEVKPPSVVRAPPVPHFGLPFQPQLPEKHHIDTCPFSFEERDRESRVMKEKRLEEQRNEEVPKFKAQPLPDFTSVVLPDKKKLEPTKPDPFRLLIDQRGAVKSRRWGQMVRLAKHQEEATAFKARPNTVTHKEPFQPKKEARTATGKAVQPFELSTEHRAHERQEYERLANEKEALRALMEEERRKEEEQQAKEEIIRLRQEQVHKAQPIRHYKTIKLKKSEVPLTVPQSPNFSDRFRL